MPTNAKLLAVTGSSFSIKPFRGKVASYIKGKKTCNLMITALTLKHEVKRCLTKI